MLPKRGIGTGPGGRRALLELAFELFLQETKTL
jgi:hypothetical protein